MPVCCLLTDCCIAIGMSCHVQFASMSLNIVQQFSAGACCLAKCCWPQMTRTCSKVSCQVLVVGNHAVIVCCAMCAQLLQQQVLTLADIARAASADIAAAANADIAASAPHTTDAAACLSVIHIRLQVAGRFECLAVCQCIVLECLHLNRLNTPVAANSMSVLLCITQF